MADNDKRPVDDATGTETTGHVWDGITELDTPLPRWWLYIFYASIAAAIIIWVLVPAWPLANSYTKGVLDQSVWSDRAIVATDIAELQSERAPFFQQLADAGVQEIQSSEELRQFALAAGESAFGDYCATCHGAGGAGAPGYPVLADNDWLWGGSLSEIEHTIQVGVRSEHPDARISQMPAFGRDGLLSDAQISDLTEYVISISAASARLEPDTAAVGRAASLYQEQCAICHGADGHGDRTQGAPNLTDDIWLYGGTRAEIHNQIVLGRGGVMPSWEARFDPAMIHALAFYVWERGGGEAEVQPASVEAIDSGQ